MHQPTVPSIHREPFDSSNTKTFSSPPWPLRQRLKLQRNLNLEKEQDGQTAASKSPVHSSPSMTTTSTSAIDLHQHHCFPYVQHSFYPASHPIKKTIPESTLSNSITLTLNTTAIQTLSPRSPLQDRKSPSRIVPRPPLPHPRRALLHHPRQQCPSRQNRKIVLHRRRRKLRSIRGDADIQPKVHQETAAAPEAKREAIWYVQLAFFSKRKRLHSVFLADVVAVMG